MEEEFFELNTGQTREIEMEYFWNGIYIGLILGIIIFAVIFQICQSLSS